MDNFNIWLINLSISLFIFSVSFIISGTDDETNSLQHVRTSILQYYAC